MPCSIILQLYFISIMRPEGDYLMLLRNRLLSIDKRGRTYRPNPLRWVSKLCLYSRRVSWRVPVVKRAFLYSLYQKRKTSPAASPGCNDDQCSRQRLVVLNGSLAWQLQWPRSGASAAAVDVRRDSCQVEKQIYTFRKQDSQWRENQFRVDIVRCSAGQDKPKVSIYSRIVFQTNCIPLYSHTTLASKCYRV